MTERSKLRGREPSRICTSSILNKFRQSSSRKEHVCFKYFVAISAKKERKKEKCNSEESLQYLGTTIIKVCTRKLNSIMTLNAGNPGPVYVNELQLS